MKLFQCQHCRALLYFENSQCVSCGLELGYLCQPREIDGARTKRMRRGARSRTEGAFRYCANAQHEVCNWLVAAEQPEIYCAACRHNRTIPGPVPAGQCGTLAQDRNRQAPAVLHAAQAAPAARQPRPKIPTVSPSISCGDQTGAPPGPGDDRA